MLTDSYKGWVGHYEYYPKEGLYYGRLLNTTDVITFQGCDPDQLQVDFENAVDDYVEFKNASI